MNQAEKIGGIALMALAIVYLYRAMEYPYGLEHGVPGPGLLPLLLGTALLLLSLCYTLRTFLPHLGEKKNFGPAMSKLLSPAWVCTFSISSPLVD